MNNIATPPDDAAEADPGPPSQVRPEFAHWLPTLGFYAGWTGLAWVSHLAGHSTIDTVAAAIMAAGILVTNGLLAFLAKPTQDDDDPAFGLARSGLAVAWVTVYAVLINGHGELLPGMYLTAVFLAVFQSGAERVQQLALASGGSYALAVAVRALSSADGALVWGEILQCLGVLIILGLLTTHARRIEAGRRDLTDKVARLKYEMQRVTRTAERDHLTKSFNRQYIMEALVREKARADRSGRSFSVCIFDLDRFKALNDEHGHLVGDRALAVFANRARRALRSMDAINPTRFRRSLGRMGGEEFIAVLPGTGLEGAAICAERVREAVGLHLVDEKFRVTVSAGVAEYRHGETIPELLTRADQALYAAKRGGRNRVRLSAAPARKDSSPQKPELRIVR
jgi:diguanylate cyclase (GGDEF)-like protein